MVRDACNDLAPHDPRCACIVTAIFLQDSACATAGVGSRFQNPGNLRCLHPKDAPYKGECKPAAYGSYESFENLETGIRANVELYARRFAGLPYDSLVRRWAATTPETNPSYFASVRSCYPGTL